MPLNDSSPEKAPPLSGLRVIDMTSLAMGPLAGQILGDYGADVIKVEPPAGDSFRHSLPMLSPNMGNVYLQFNRNKRSLALDLKAPPCKDICKSLIQTADILISNIRPNAMAGLGLDYESVRNINPGIIYCSAYGFSEEGPYAGRPAADDTIQAMSGLVSLQGRNHGAPEFVQSIIADKAAGHVLVHSILAAVIHRMRTGRGQSIELPMFETMVSFVMPEHMSGLTYEPSAGPAGYSRVMDPARRPYPTKDGYLSVLPYTTAQWKRFFRMIDRHDLADDPQIENTAKRNTRISELYGAIGEATPGRTTAEWKQALQDADILFGEVLAPDDLITDPHLVAVGLFEIIEHPTEGNIRLINPPVRFSDFRSAITALPPSLGQHSVEILEELGITQSVIQSLIDDGHVVSSAAATSSGASVRASAVRSK